MRFQKQGKRNLQYNKVIISKNDFYVYIIILRLPLQCRLHPKDEKKERNNKKGGMKMKKNEGKKKQK